MTVKIGINGFGRIGVSLNNEDQKRIVKNREKSQKPCVKVSLKGDHT